MACFSLAFTSQMAKKMDYISDVVPEGWAKPIHSKGSMAKVRFEPNRLSPFTGLYKEPSCALIRLSLTNNPHQKHLLKPTETRGVAPGVALKFFVDGQPSQDLSLLTTLEGQGNNYNFFSETFSNIIPMGKGMDMKVVHEMFKTASKYPERLSVSGMSEQIAKGHKVQNPLSPVQLFFVPVYQMSELEMNEDIREKFHRIPEKTVLFKVYGYTPESMKQAYANYSKDDIERFMKNSVYMGKIITESPFVSSSFGDKEIFFKHKRFESDMKP